MSFLPEDPLFKRATSWGSGQLPATALRRYIQKVGAKTHDLTISHAITEDSPLGKRSMLIFLANFGNDLEVGEKRARQLMCCLKGCVDMRWHAVCRRGEADGRPRAADLFQVKVLRSSLTGDGKKLSG